MSKSIIPIKILKLIGFIGLIIFAVVGLSFVVVFLALKWQWTNVPGMVDFNDRYFKMASDRLSQIKDGTSTDSRLIFSADECKLWLISKLYPQTGQSLFLAYSQDLSAKNLSSLITAAELKLQNDANYQTTKGDCEKLNSEINLLSPSAPALYSWQTSPEWLALKAAIIKDAPVLRAASLRAGIKPRLVLTVLVVEQLRLYNSERELFKQVFQPLKILGNQSKFSWGVMGLKEDTAKAIETHLKNSDSPFYLGPTFTDMLSFQTDNPTQERFNRLVNEDDHYYSYLYAALFLKQIIAQWEKSGFAVGGRPEVLATIFNLGFGRSEPKTDPQVGGAEINIGADRYSFGGLAYEFYYSGELADLFPL